MVASNTRKQPGGKQSLRSGLMSFQSYLTLLFQFHRPVSIIEERLPRLVLLVAELLGQERTALGLLWLADQRHVCFLRRAATLTDVAVQARTDDVLPGTLPTPAARYNVVERQL